MSFADGGALARVCHDELSLFMPQIVGTETEIPHRPDGRASAATVARWPSLDDL